MSSWAVDGCPNWSWTGARSSSEAAEAGAWEPEGDMTSSKGELGGDAWVVVVSCGPEGGGGAGAGWSGLAGWTPAR